MFCQILLQISFKSKGLSYNELLIYALIDFQLLFPYSVYKPLPGKPKIVENQSIESQRWGNVLHNIYYNSRF